jgi:FAD binding domain/Berberine and berberine like
VRSGGHCLDALVDNPQVQAVIDLSEMRAVDFDQQLNAFVVEPGATLGEIYRRLYYGWGVTLPGGVCPDVGAGGHVLGGGFGAISRQYGLIIDHLYAVEVVVVDASGTATAVVATRHTSDPNNDLWWAIAGGGGNNFGVATRFWFRSPNATGTDPTKLLPPAPAAVMTGDAVYPWSSLSQADFVRLGQNFGAWAAANSAPGTASQGLFANLAMPRIEAGAVVAVGQLDPTVSGNPQILKDYLSAIGQGVSATPTVNISGQVPWLASTINVPDSATALGVSGPPRWKSNVSVHNAPFTADQLNKAYVHQTSAYNGYKNPASTFALTSFGGQINATSSTATAFPHRNAIMLVAVSTVWGGDASTDAANLSWAQNFFQDLYSGTGGVPVLNAQTDGCPPNWPNVDLIGAPWNTSTTSVETLYHGANYPRLQQVKAKWDPTNVFRNQISVQLPG